MKITLFAALAVTLSLLALASAQATREGITPSSSSPVTAHGNQPQKITITRSGARSSSKGPEANFTGSVRVETLFPATTPARAAGARVTFEPGAHSAWHTHPLGQILIVTSGIGWVQQEGGEKQTSSSSGSRNILLSFVNHLPPYVLKFFGDSKGLPVVVQIPGLF
jgi:hypothetical protein